MVDLPMPWVARGAGVFSADGLHVTTVCGTACSVADDEALAALIVEAVNAHARLLEVERLARELLDFNLVADTPSLDGRVNATLAALRKALEP